MPIGTRCLLAASLWSCSGAALAQDASAALATLKAIERGTLSQPTRMRQLRIGEAYERAVRPALVAQSGRPVEAAQPDALHEAIALTIFHTGAMRHVEDMARRVEQLESVRPLTGEEAARYFRALIRSRQFEQAAALGQRLQLVDVEPVPFLRVEGRAGPASAYRVAASGAILQPLRPDLSGTRLLLVVHPLCAFSRRAEVALARLGREMPMLSTHTLRLAPPGERLFLDVLRDWNAGHPGGEILLARHEADWPMVEDWATPNFYLLQDGRVIDHFSGWPAEGNDARLGRMLGRFGRCMVGDCHSR